MLHRNSRIFRFGTKMGMKEYTETGHGRGIRQQTVFNLYSSEDQNNLKLESELLLRRFPSQQINQQQKQHKRAHANRPSYPCTQNSVTRDPGY